VCVFDIVDDNNATSTDLETVDNKFFFLAARKRSYVIVRNESVGEFRARLRSLEALAGRK